MNKINATTEIVAALIIDYENAQRAIKLSSAEVRSDDLTCPSFYTKI